MNWKSKIWKYVTAFVIVLIILNPEIVELALFVDAVGMDMFLMLLEIQVLAILGTLFNTKIKPVIAYVKYFYTRHILVFSWKHIKEEPESLMLVVPTSPATLMYMLVCSAAIGIAFNGVVPASVRDRLSSS
ncbi:MAG: hypothetical protein GY807_12485 [Gammaproteobacteria bacterium]|nr:hypothetical protein [Gammaproteobacteria bacterium]